MENSKHKRSVVLYWNASGMLLWIVMFLVAFYGEDLHKHSNMIQIPSVLLLCFYAFYQLIRWGLMDKTIVKYRNRFIAGAYNNAKRKKDGLEEIKKITKEDFRKKMNERIDPIIYLFVTLYSVLVIVSLFI